MAKKNTRKKPSKKKNLIGRVATRIDPNRRATRLNLQQRQELVNRRFQTPSTLPLNRPQFLRRVEVQPQQLDTVSRDVLSAEQAAIRESPRGPIFQENVFGYEDFRGREDFTRIS